MSSLLLRNMILKTPYTNGKPKPLLYGMSTRVLNEDYIENILQTHYNDKSIIVNKIEKHPACEKGDSFVSNVSRISIQGYRNTGRIKEAYEESLIVKELPPPEQRDLYRSDIAMKNECSAYNQIIPTLKRYFAGPFIIPECIYASNNLIILHDLCKEGYKTIQKANKGITLKECEIILQGLARLHAASFVCKQKEPETFTGLTKLVKELLYHDNGESKLLNHQTSFIQNIVDMFKEFPSSAEHQATIDVLENLKLNSRSQILHLLRNPPEHSVICHGDSWMGNIMLNPKNELKLLDLQIMRYGSVASDLSYLLYINLPPKVRISNTDSLLGLYLYELQQNTKKMGVNMDHVLTKDWLDNEMQTYATFGVIFGMWVTPVFYIKGEVLLNSELLKTSKRQTDPECQERLKDLILGYVRAL